MSEAQAAELIRVVYGISWMITGLCLNVLALTGLLCTAMYIRWRIK